MHDQPVIKMLGLTGHTLELVCPYQLGIASKLIDPYHHVWLSDKNSNERIPNSGEEKTYNVYVNQSSPVTYSCGINMTRCSTCKNVDILPASSSRVEFRITKAGECLNFICVCAPYTLCHLVQSLFQW